MLALMGLLPWTATVTADELTFDGHNLLTMDAKARRKIVGNDLAMIFQEPMSSLNPCFTVGWQIREALRVHLGMGRRERQKRAIELFEQVGIPDPEKRLSAFPAPDVGRDEPACDDRHGDCLQAQAADC